MNLTRKEALHALVDGKRICATTARLPKPIVFRMSEDGEIRGDDKIDLSRVLPADWQYSLYVEPNPHEVGTFNWAREEAKRGNRVCRGSCPQIEFSGTAFMPHMPWALEHIDAKDWEHYE